MATRPNYKFIRNADMIVTSAKHKKLKRLLGYSFWVLLIARSCLHSAWCLMTVQQPIVWVSCSCICVHVYTCLTCTLRTGNQQVPEESPQACHSGNESARPKEEHHHLGEGLWREQDPERAGQPCAHHGQCSLRKPALHLPAPCLRMRSVVYVHLYLTKLAYAQVAILLFLHSNVARRYLLCCSSGVRRAQVSVLIIPQDALNH